MNDIEFVESESLELAKLSDLELLVQWQRNFIIDVGLADEMPPDDELKKRVEFAIGNGSSLLWKDESKSVSAIGFIKMGEEGARINRVYTPLEFRKRYENQKIILIHRSYATKMVYTLAKKLLKEYGMKYLVLFTDAKNPTTNHIYPLSGFKFVKDNVELAIKVK